MTKTFRTYVFIAVTVAILACCPPVLAATVKQVTKDTNNDGKTDQIVYFDQRGRIEKVEMDTNQDRTPDARFSYKNGVLRVKEIDEDRDGQVTKVEEDTNGDGQPDIWETYDAAEALIQREKDLDFDGRPDVTKTP